ncbi:MAG TPA: hypothetical protein VEF90_17740 [Xanthobacteraceae bacterium]|nr:hypothetical protein [Xanthobacteraceae bacterium]
MELKDFQVGDIVDVRLKVTRIDDDDDGLPLGLAPLFYESDEVAYWMKPSDVYSLHDRPFKAGDRAKSDIRDFPGEILKVRGDTAIMLFDDGHLHGRVPLSRLSRV